MWPTFRNSALAALALLAAAGSALGQEEIVGGNVFRTPYGVTTPVMTAAQLPGSTTNQNYGWQIGYWGNGTGSTAATGRLIPIPITGQISGLEAAVPAAQAGLAVTAYIAGADRTVTCALSSGSAPFTCSDTTHADNVNAGDLFQWHWNPNGSTWAQASTLSQVSFLLTAAGVQQGALFAGPQQFTVGNSALYYSPGMGTIGISGTEATVSAILPMAITVTGLYVYPNATQGTDPAIINVCKNGTSACSTLRSGIWCQLTASAGTGCCVTTNPVLGTIGGGPACTPTTAMSFAAGDTISIQYACPGSAGSGTGGGTDCVTSLPGISLSYTPGIPYQAVVTSMVNTNSPNYFPLYGLFVSATQTNYQIVPYLGGRTLTFANLIACGSLAPGPTTSTRTITAQVSANPSTLPTDTSLAATLSVANGACPSAMSGVLLAGNQDTTHTFTAPSGGLVDYHATASGSPTTGGQNWKMSMTANIQ